MPTADRGPAIAGVGPDVGPWRSAAAFLRYAAREATHGGLRYRLWILGLLAVVGLGVLSYAHQVQRGLVDEILIPGHAP